MLSTKVNKMKLSVWLLTTLITLGIVTPAQAETPLINGVLRGVLNSVVHSQRRHHSNHRAPRNYTPTYRRNRQIHHGERRYQQPHRSNYRRQNPHDRDHGERRVYYRSTF